MFLVICFDNGDHVINKEAQISKLYYQLINNKYNE